MVYNSEPMNRKLSIEMRSKLTEFLRREMKAKNFTFESLAEEAERRIHEAASRRDPALDEEDIALAGEIEVSTRNAYSLMTFPSNPLGKRDSRIRFLGIVLALGVDRSEASRLAGGL